MLARSGPLVRGRRVTATVCTPDGEVEPITFRPSPTSGLAEERAHPRPAPAHRAAAEPVAAQELRRRAPAVGGGHLPAPRRREGEPERRALHRDGGGPRRDAAARRGRRGRRLPDRRAPARRLPRRAAPRPGAARRPPPPRAQPDLPVRLAVDRAAGHRDGGVRPRARAAHRRRRARRDRAAGAAAGGRGRAARGRPALLLLPRRGRRDDGHRPADRADAAARRLHPEGAALAGPRRRLPVRAGAAARRSGRQLRRARPRRARPARPRRPAAGPQQRRPRRRPGQHADASATPRASPAWRCSATRPRRSAPCRSPSAPASSPRSTWPRSAGVPVEWFALSSGARISMDSGTENMDWVARALRRLITFTQARRRGQRRRRRHQRRRAAVLERRGDDAHAHQGHPGDDAGQRDGAHRQALARLLRRRRRPRTTSASAATTASWARTARRSTGRRTSPPRSSCCSPHYDHTYVAPGERWARPAPTSDPVDRDVREFPHDHPSSDFTTVGDIFSAVRQPRAQEAVRHPHGHARGHRPGPPAARAVGGRWPTPTPPSSTTPTSAATR